MRFDSIDLIHFIPLEIIVIKYFKPKSQRIMNVSDLKFFASFMLLNFHTFIFSQNKIIEIKYEKDRAGSAYVFECTNHSFVSYIVEINFSTLTNLSADVSLPFKGTVTPGSNRLFTLKPTGTSGTPNFNYSYSFRKGCLNSKPEVDFPYLLPIQADKTAQSFELYNISEKYANESAPKDWYALGIKTTEGDTIYASRKGVVGEVVSDQKEVSGENVSFNRNINFIEIQQEDCTFAKYELFKENGVFVKVGEPVQAGQPLGVIGGRNFSSGSHVRLSVYYAYVETVKKEGKDTNKKNYSAYVPIQFWIDGKLQKLEKNTTYKSEHPESIVTKEMTKREKKKWLENRKK